MHNVARSATGRNALEDTGQIPIMFGGPEDRPVPPDPTNPDFARIQSSNDFVALRTRLRRFIFPMSALFFCWYMTYVLLAAYAHDFMSYKVFGEINLGIILGGLQFISTIAITVGYVRFANNKIDPQVEKIREQAGVGSK